MKTHVTFILDSSGSMSKIKSDTVGGFNEFLVDQRAEEGSATVTLYDFNDTIERVYQAQAIEQAPELTAEAYTPGGRTALHDAVATATSGTHDRIKTLPERDQPDHVVVVILTDGRENASETPADTVREQVETRQEADDWEFLFIGANQDAALSAAEVGIEEKNSLNMAYSQEGTEAAYDSISDNISQSRRQGKTDGFDESDRKRQRNLRDESSE